MLNLTIDLSLECRLMSCVKWKCRSQTLCNTTGLNQGNPRGEPLPFCEQKRVASKCAWHKQTVKTRCPLLRIDDLLDCLQGANYFTSLNLARGYHQIEIREADRPTKAFRTPLGLYQYTVLSFDLTTAPATFQAAMNALLGPLVQNGVLIYLDAILIYSKTWKEHLRLTREVLPRIQEQRAIVYHVTINVVTQK